MSEKYTEVHAAEEAIAMATVSSSSSSSSAAAVTPDEPPTEQQFEIPSVMLAERRRGWIWNESGQCCCRVIAVIVAIAAFLATMCFVAYGEGFRAGRMSHD